MQLRVIIAILFYTVQASAQCSATVSCSGSGCACGSHGPTSGSFDTGYQNNWNCYWTISSSRPITLQFSRFNLETNYDYVTVSSNVQLCRASNVNGCWGPYTSNTGSLSISLTADYSILGSGIAGSWYLTCPQPCAAGSTGPDGSCTACVAGKYKIASGPAACTDCASGKYSTTTAATLEAVCITCIAGKYTTASGSTACTNCATGTYSAAGAATCTACSSGTSNCGTGNFGCTTGTCNTATHSALQWSCGVSGSDTCSASESSDLGGLPAYLSVDGNLGTFGHTNGAPSWWMLDFGRTIRVTQVIVYNRADCCQDRLNGYTIAVGESTTVGVNPTCGSNLPAPMTSPFMAQVTCTTPLNGRYLIVSAATAWLHLGEVQVTGCPCPYVATLCSAGSTGPDGGPCASCVAGKYKIATGSAVCTDCGAGTYSTTVGATIATTCIACPANSNSPISSSVLAGCTCNSGSTGPDGGTCSQCVAGKYKIATGSAACTDCAAGKYLSTTGATLESACVTCPSNSNSPSASTSVAACTCNAGSTGPDGGLTLTTDSTNLVAWYKLNGDLTDSTGRTGSLINAGGTLAFAQDATLNSNLPYSWYAVGSGTSNLNYARSPVINRNVPLSFAFWFKTTGSGGYTILSYGDKSVENPSIQFDYNGGQLSVATALSTQWTTVPLTTGLVVNTWYFVVYTLSNANPVSTILYIDGTQRATGTGSTGQTLPRFKDLTVANSGDTGRGFAGHIGDIRIYDKVLIQAEITSLFTNMPTPCTTCVAGKYKIVSGSAACTDCATGTYSTTVGATIATTCIACPANSNSPSPSSVATACTCNVGYTGPDGGACSPCAAGKYKIVSGSAACTDCATGTYSTTVGATIATTCIACPANSNSPSPSTTVTACTCNIGFTGPNGAPCMACVAGKYKIATGSAACTDCATGTYSTTVGATIATTCIACPANSNSPSPSTTVTACTCNAGSTGPDSGPCVSCVAGKYKSATGSAACTNCGSGTYSATIGATAVAACLACPANSGASCVGCSASTGCTCNGGFTGPDGGVCSACDPGTYQTLQCQDDPAFEYINGFPCSEYAPGGSGEGYCVESSNDFQTCSYCCASCATECPGGGSGISMSVCSPCEKGTFADTIGATACSPCSAGKFADGPGAMTCSSCDAGTYESATGSAECTACGVGTYSTTVGATVATTCLTCPISSDSPVKSSALTACTCNVGYTGPDGGVCSTCAAGKYKSVTGSATCTDCGVGTYSTTVGATVATTCLTCPTSSDSPVTSTALTACTCNVGYTGPDGGVCSTCAAGKYKSATGSAACTNCGSGTYSSTIGATAVAACVFCPNNTFSAVIGSSDASVCQPCQSNAISAAGSVSQEYCYCKAGYAHAEGEFRCNACTPGTYNSQLAKRACSNCTIGMYSANYSATGPETCLFCPAGQWSPEGSANCNFCPPNSNTLGISGLVTDCVCDAGYTGPAGSTCTPCTAGKYKSVTGSATCTDCGTGTYSATVGATVATTCLTCPTSSNSPVASTVLTACTCNVGYTGPDGGVCSNCVAGKYKSLSGSAACTNCGSGTYSDTIAATGLMTCLACPADMTSPLGSTSSAACVYPPCNAGYTGPDGICSTCAAGTYKVGIGSAACTPCVTGKYSSTPAATADTACLSCPANSNSPSQSSATTACTCNAGYSGPDGGLCTACAAGKYKSFTGSATCTSCPVFSGAVCATCSSTWF